MTTQTTPPELPDNVPFDEVGLELKVIHCLVDALEDLAAAKEKTSYGAVEGNCIEAINLVRDTIAFYVTGKSGGNAI